MISVIITSAIEPTNPKYKALSSRERLFQTVFTVSSIVSQIPSASIYIIDSSLNNYGDAFTRYYNNVHFTHLNSVNSRLANRVLASSKSKGECLLLLEALSIYPKIKQTDYILKVSGRYFFENLNIDLLNPDNLDKFLFVRRDSDRRQWIDDNGYDYTKLNHNDDPCDYRNVLTSIIYGVGRQEYDFYIGMLSRCIDKIDNECFYYDIENLLYYYLRSHDRSNRILATDWVIRGWNGESCVYMNL